MNSHEDSAVCGYSLEGSTRAMQTALLETGDKIDWAEDATKLYETIQKVFDQQVTENSTNLVEKVKDVEKYVTIDLIRHIALSLGRPPYYLQRLQALVTKSLELCSREDEELSVKVFDHLTAELQSACVEYGFCSSLEAIYDTEEASNLLKQLGSRLDVIEKELGKEDASVAIAQLHDVVATLNGIQQAMTPANIEKLWSKFRAIDDRILRLENNLSSANIKADSELFVRYLAGQYLLRKPFVEALYNPDPSDVINDNMIHPGTRAWILDRISRWLYKTEKRMYILCGKQGSGKTALASALCKLHNHDIVARHFFDVSYGSSLHNQVNGLIQSIASDLCRVLPEYLNYLDDKFTDTNVSDLLSGPWENTYNVLLKEPLQNLYGAPTNQQTPRKKSKLKLIIIDGLDQSTFQEWTNLKSFLERWLKDFSSSICIFVTVRTKHSAAFSIDDVDNIDVLQFENRAWQSRHIKDVEIYLSSSVGAILSGEDERGTPQHAKVDHTTLQNTMDDLLKSSAGRFDYAIKIMETFAQEMASGGQFLGSVKRALMPMRQSHEDYDERISEFASPYRAYRDKEGRTVDVRVMRQSHYLMDKSRVALIRGRHQIKELTNSGK